MNNQQAINLLKGLEQSLDDYCELNDEGKTAFGMAITALELFGNSEQLPSAQPEIIRCKDCKFYSPMNRETKTGICNLIMHQNFGDNWFCAGAERRSDESDRKRGGD